jgi:hypothetical protein
MARFLLCVSRGEEEKMPILKRGDRIRLRDGVLTHVKTREWIFDQKENDSFVVIHETLSYGLTVKPSEIDWEEFCERKKKESIN